MKEIIIEGYDLSKQNFKEEYFNKELILNPFEVSKLHLPFKRQKI